MADRISVEEMCEADLFLVEMASANLVKIVESMQWFENHPGIAAVDYDLMQRTGESCAMLELEMWQNAVRHLKIEMARA